MPRLPDCRIVGSELIIKYTSHGDAFAGYRMIRDLVEAAEREARAKSNAPICPYEECPHYRMPAVAGCGCRGSEG